MNRDLAGPDPADRAQPTRLQAVVESKPFQRIVMALIFLNALIIAAETYPQITARAGRTLDLADRVILIGFVFEILLRLVAARPWYRFFASGWNLFDTVIVAAGFVPGGASLTVLRLLRIVRILRAVTISPNLQRLIRAVLRSFPAMANTGLLLVILLFAYAAAGAHLFSESDPTHFGSFHGTWLTLFQILTLENWPDIMAAVLPHHSWAWIYFVTFILFGTFIAMNLVVGIIVNSMQEEETERDKAADDVTHDRLASIEEKVDQILKRGN